MFGPPTIDCYRAECQVPGPSLTQPRRPPAAVHHLYQSPPRPARSLTLSSPLLSSSLPSALCLPQLCFSGSFSLHSSLFCFIFLFSQLASAPHLSSHSSPPPSYFSLLPSSSSVLFCTFLSSPLLFFPHLPLLLLCLSLPPLSSSPSLLLCPPLNSFLSSSILSSSHLSLFSLLAFLTPFLPGPSMLVTQGGRE